MTFYIVSVLTILTATSAQAQDAQGFTCMSASNNVPFVSSDQSELMARTNAIRACQASPSTNNAECDSNVQCAPTSPEWDHVSCVTTSNNIPFTGAGSDEMAVKAQVIMACEANASTNNAQCFSAVTCDHSGNNPYAHYSCMTTSNNKMFPTNDQSQDVAKADAIRACEADASTNNAQCEQSAVCERVDQGSVGYACTTTSNSIPFALEERGKYKFDVMADVVNECNANPSTNDAQCASAVNCQPIWN